MQKNIVGEINKLNLSQYHQNLSEKFASIFIRYHDNDSGHYSQKTNINLASHSLKKLSQREDILFSQYPMLKKGKKFNLQQSRIFKIDNEVLIQLDQNGQQRQLPYPTVVSQEYKQDMQTNHSITQWSIQSCPFRLNLQFDERSPVCVYFEKLVSCQQIHSFLIYKSKPHYKQTFKAVNQRIYKKKIIQNFMSEILNAKQSQSLILVQRNREQQKHRISKSLKNQYTNQRMRADLLYKWAAKAKSIRQISKAMNTDLASSFQAAEKVSKIQLQINQLQFIQWQQQQNHQQQLGDQTKLNDSCQQVKLVGGVIKIWIDNRTHSQKIQLGQQTQNGCNLQKQPTFFDDKVQYKKKDLPQLKIFNIMGQNNQLTLKDMNLGNCLQVQIQIIKSDGDEIIKQNWRSQRWHIKDWVITWLQDSKGPKLIPLYASRQKMLMKVTVKQLECGLLPSNLKQSIKQCEDRTDPFAFGVLKSMIAPQILQKLARKLKKKDHLKNIINITSIPEHIQQKLSALLLPQFYHHLRMHYSYRYATTLITYHYYNKLYKSLNLQALITKFYANYPFNQYIHVDRPGTFVYEYLVDSHNNHQSTYLMNQTHRQFSRQNQDWDLKTSKLYYYDAEKLVWKFQAYNLRRFLSALKTFDEIPRINFTEPFYWLCVRCLQIVNKDVLMYTNSQTHDRYDCMFQNSIIGHESKAFFLVLALLKVAAPVLLYQKQKKALSQNSFLFHYILKTEYGSIYSKILSTQINIQAFFGIQMTSLFSNLLPMNIFMIILEKFIEERKLLSQPEKNKKMFDGLHSPSLVSGFLTVIVLLDRLFGKSKSSCLYMSAEHYLKYIKTFCEPMFLSEHTSQFIIEFQFNYNLCSSYLQKQHKNSQEYLQMLIKMEKFYNSTQYTVNQQGMATDANTNTALAQLTLGQILQKLYSSFNCYKHKNQGDIRKIFIVVDNITLGNKQPAFIHGNNAKQNLNQSQNLQASKRIIKSLVISVYQGNNKLYYHELVNIDAQQDCKSQYNNLKHCIQLKLVKLDVLQFIIYEKVSSTVQLQLKNSSKSALQNIIYTCKVDPRQLPSNYYIQTVNVLTLQNKNSSIYRNDSKSSKQDDNSSQAQAIKKMNSIHLHRNCSVMMQIYIKDSCEVEYIDNMVPEDYTSHFLFKNQFNLHSPNNSPSKENTNHDDPSINKYKNDIMFCNHYFRTFRMPQNNFNLLYSKLGWYGNHYLIPDDRLVMIYKQKVVRDNASKYNLNQSSSSHSNKKQVRQNSIQIKILNLNECQLSRLYNVLFYCRCIFGRGLIPKSNLMPRSNMAESETYLRSKILYKNNSSHGIDRIISQNQKNRFQNIKQNDQNAVNLWYDSAASTLGYLMNNFNGPNSCFIAYYWKMVKQLPIIRYLGFRTKQFYILGNCRMQIQFKIPVNLSPTKFKPGSSKQIPTYTQIHGGNKVANFIKNKIMTSKTNSNPAIQHHPNIVQQQQYTYFIKKFHVIFSNSHHSQNSQKNQKLIPKKFLSFKDISLLQAEDLCQQFNDYLRYQLSEKLMEQSSITLVFTYCEDLLYLDQFNYLLKLNISKYLCTPRLLRLKNKPKFSMPKIKSKKSDNSDDKNDLQYVIQFKDKQIPNMQINELYQIILQTDEQLHLCITEQYVCKYFYGHRHQQSKKPVYNNKRYPQFYRRYADWAYINGRWISVQVLVILTSSHYCLAYVQQKYSNIKILIDIQNIMFGVYRSNKNNCQPELSVLNYTDQQMRGIENCIKKQLISF